MTSDGVVRRTASHRPGQQPQEVHTGKKGHPIFGLLSGRRNIQPSIDKVQALQDYYLQWTKKTNAALLGAG